ncbi:colicin immunity domain-containing protein [Seminibacterium arietis]|uniref:Colicin immunity domain-containing protein n=1 Tax=Seminibacterium arietis TaxID=1173502 RepID=A0ABW3I5T3_9PAST|nr:colicin immunity domain-containing protein [Histophilus somni]
MTELLKLAIDFHNKKISVNEFQELYLDKWNGGTKGVTQDEQNKEISIYYATECYNPNGIYLHNGEIDEVQLRKEIAEHLRELKLVD